MFWHVSSPPVVATPHLYGNPVEYINFVGLDVQNTSSDQFAGKMKILAVGHLSSQR